ncbi:MAG: hypothetical protein KKI08_04990 [Armatimonadetes bacterium]|nr:hypothetical protein [Armatimonadota bacterium]
MPSEYRLIKAVWDGEKVLPAEPLPLEPGTAVDVLFPGTSATWAEKHLGLPRLVLLGPGPTVSEMIIEDRGDRA